jgi:hypothetical protein
MEKGWVKLHRKIIDSAVFKSEKDNLLKAWIYCMAKANHKKNQAIIGLQKVDLKPGQFITGRNKLAEDLGFKPSNTYQAWRMLKILENMGNLSIKPSNKFSIITVNNWHTYQGVDNESEQVIEQQVSNKRATSEQQVSTNKNVKNDKNDKNISSEFFFLSNLLKTRILQNNPKANITNSQLKQWTEIIRLMIERDNRTLNEIETLIEFSQKDDFWKTNILSMQKLRKQFDQLTIKRNQKLKDQTPANQKSIVPKLYKPNFPKLTPEQIADNKRRLKELSEKF